MNLSETLTGRCALFLSPSKTQKLQPMTDSAEIHSWSSPLFEDDARRLAGELNARDAAYFARREKLSDERAEQQSDLWRDWGKNPARSSPAGYLYRGPAFTALDYPGLKVRADSPSLFILDALYGLLRPADIIYPYRLDFKYRDLRMDGQPLYDHWKNRIAGHLLSADWDLFIDLSSSEFTPLIPDNGVPRLRLDFRERRRGEWRAVSANSKKLRGATARFILQTPDLTPEILKLSAIEGYRLNESLSSGVGISAPGTGAAVGENLWVFSPPD